MSSSEQQHFPSEYHELLRSQKYSDLTITCQGRQWRAHRAIICPRSKYFAAVCDGAFQESCTGTIDIKEADPAIVERLLLYFYTADYNDAPGSTSKDSESSPSPTQTQRSLDLHFKMAKPGQEHEHVHLGNHRVQESLIINAQMYALADRIDIPNLRKLAQVKFERRVHKSSLKIFGPPSAFLEVIKTTPANDKGLRRFVLEQCAYMVSWPLPSNKRQDWQNLLREDADFTADLLQRTVNTYETSLEAQEHEFHKLNHRLNDQFAAEHQRTLDLQNALDELKKGVADMVAALNKGGCNVCHCNMQPVVRPDDSSSPSKTGYVVRCRKCTATLVF